MPVSVFIWEKRGGVSAHASLGIIEELNGERRLSTEDYISFHPAHSSIARAVFTRQESRTSSYGDDFKSYDSVTEIDVPNLHEEAIRAYIDELKATSPDYYLWRLSCAATVFKALIAGGKLGLLRPTNNIEVSVLKEKFWAARSWSALAPQLRRPIEHIRGALELGVIATIALVHGKGAPMHLSRAELQTLGEARNLGMCMYKFFKCDLESHVEMTTVSEVEGLAYNFGGNRI